MNIIFLLAFSFALCSIAALLFELSILYLYICDILINNIPLINKLDYVIQIQNELNNKKLAYTNENIAKIVVLLYRFEKKLKL